MIGLAKSGTSILTYRIATNHQPEKQYFEPKTKLGQNDFLFHRKVTLKHSKILTKIIYYHDQPQQLKRIFNYYHRIVWIVRDPRDHLISTFFYSWNHQREKRAEQFRNKLALVMKKEENPRNTPFASLCKGFIDPLKQSLKYDGMLEQFKAHKNKIFVLKYEDLVDQNCAALEKYLGFPIHHETELPDQLQRVKRSAKYGDWRHWYTPEDVETLKPVFNTYLDVLGYDPDDWKLDAIDLLPSAYGSQYMEKLYHRKFEKDPQN